MRFYVVETCKNWYTAGDPNKSIPVFLTGIFGGVAGAVSVLGNTPIDVVKTRLQVHFVPFNPLSHYPHF